MNRSANLPGDMGLLDYVLSKADLLEIAWSLASLCNGVDSTDDNDATLARLLLEAETIAANQGRKVGNLNAKLTRYISAVRARRAEMGIEA